MLAEALAKAAQLKQPSTTEIDEFAKALVKELKDLGYIDIAQVNIRNMAKDTDLIAVTESDRWGPRVTIQCLGNAKTEDVLCQFPNGRDYAPVTTGRCARIQMWAEGGLTLSEDLQQSSRSGYLEQRDGTKSIQFDRTEDALNRFSTTWDNRAAFLRQVAGVINRISSTRAGQKLKAQVASISSREPEYS